MAIKNMYLDNVLNQFDTYTYKWKLMMCHPQEAHRFEQLISPDNNRVVVLAESGVESEINIGSVNHSLTLAFKKNQDRHGYANYFSFNLIEPGGATYFNRILEAARRLTIENHLKAAYLLELKFIGTKDNITTENVVGPYYYVCTTTGVTFDYADGATNYRMDLVETKLDAFKIQQLHLKQDTGNIVANTFGEFLTKFQERIKEQEHERVFSTNFQSIPDEYFFKTSWKDTESWAFASASSSGDNTFKGTSVKGAGGQLTFSFNKGTAVSDCIVVAILHTTNMRKLPDGAGGFHKDNPEDGEAKAASFRELSKWFVFDSETEYGHYDVRTKRYQNIITYDLKEFLEPNVIHDPDSYLKLITDSKLQKDRIKKILRNGLLRKRFDYTFTGLNTEVLNLDISLQNTFFQLQALNGGKLASRSVSFAGTGGPGEKYSLQLNAVAENNNERQALQARSRKLQTQKDNITGLDGMEAYNMLKRDIVMNNEALRRNAMEGKVLRAKQSELYDALPKANSKLDDIGLQERYISQDQLKNNFTRESELVPLTFEQNIINSKATNGPDNQDAGAVMLGAVEINLNTLGDLTNQVMQIKGDPYWLGRPKGSKSDLQGANYEKGGMHYFLNMNFPTYPNEETGLMDVNDQNFGIIGLYRVFNVEATYSDGQFTMQLQAFRDLNTNIGLTIEDLLSGEVNDSEAYMQAPRFMGIDGPADAEVQKNDPIQSITGPELGEVQDGGATGTVTESQSGIRNQPITPELKNILQQAATETGLDVVVYSGGQPSEGVLGVNRTGSTRHDNGRAADVRLKNASGRILTLDNPADVPLIQNYLQTAKKYGATGFGAGNNYMGNNGFHIDNVPGKAGSWGGEFDPIRKTYTHANAPKWVQKLGETT